MKTMAPVAVGEVVLCNGYLGRIAKVCTGDLTGMYEVRVPGGLVCVGASEFERSGTRQSSSLYRGLIREAAGCAAEEVVFVEEVMRNRFGTLDGLSGTGFRREARKAYAILKGK